ncbi:MAG: carboxypeptidase regulatory-like domain-containing protein, partial [Acidobacteria bacterium]|nr:carboxypeptidase regulatory-like domain-containing protein [Acidobacteriota bacterium]
FAKPYAAMRDTYSIGQALKPYPQYGNVNTWSGNGDRSGHSTYHALVTSLERRISNGLYLQGSYVWSKIITDTDVVDSGGRAMDQYNRRWEKSVGAFDLPHNAKLSYIVEAPFGKGKKFDLGKAANFAVGGWRISAIHVYTSGQPLQLVGGGIGLGGRSAAVVKTLDNWNAVIPDNPNIRASSGYTSFFNTLCSIAANCNAAGTAVIAQPTVFGQAPRYNGRARRMSNLNENLSLQKSFQMTERFKLDFRWEMFNIFNRVVFNAPVTDITSTTFGRITSQFNTPRQMQFGLKLYF